MEKLVIYISGHIAGYPKQCLSAMQTHLNITYTHTHTHKLKKKEKKRKKKKKKKKKKKAFPKKVDFTLFPGYLTDVRQRLFEMKALFTKRQVHHPKITALCKEVETWLKKKRAKSGDNEQKVV